jgi:hypothetical protein
MKTNQAPLVNRVDFESAEEFYDSLSLKGKYFFESSENEYVIFRGHSNSDFHLVPSALRKNTGGQALHRLSPYRAEGSLESDSNLIQIFQEYSVLRRFFDVADNTGLPLPEDSQDLRETLEFTIFHLLRCQKNSSTGN